MDAPLSLENIPFMWGIAFMLDIVTGLVMFGLILRKASPAWALGSACWIGWWSWASAFTLIINMVVGTSNPFSYHQIGVLTESMTNLGVLWWICAMASKNWYIQPKDWALIEELRTDLYCTNLKKAVKKSYENRGD